MWGHGKVFTTDSRAFLLRDRAREIILPRSHCQDRAREIILLRSHCEIVPLPSRSNSFRLNLSAAWSLPPLDRSRRPWLISLFLNLPLPFPRFAITLSSSSLSQFDQMVLCIENDFVLIFVSLRMVLIWEWVCFDLRMVLFGSWENGWENVRN